MALIIAPLLIIILFGMPIVYLSDAFRGIKTLQKPAEERHPDETWDAWSAIIIIVFAIFCVIWLA